MKWLIIIGIVLLIVLFPVGIRGSYGQKGTYLWIIIGPFRFRLYPGKKRRKAQKTGQQRNRKDDFASHEGVQKNNSGSAADFIPLLQLIFDLLKDFRKKLRVNHLYLNVTLAGGDPGELAINYGRAWASLGNLMPILERFFTIKKRDLQIQCSFESDTTVVEASIDLTMRIGALIMMVCTHGVRILRKYFHIVNNAKDGAIS